MDTANNAIYAASTVKEIKRAFQAKAMIQRYGTSGYLQLLDEQPAPLETRDKNLKKERLSQAAEQKRQFLKELKSDSHMLC